MARHTKTQPLSPAELEYFDEFLSGLQGSIRSFEALDGLFCALICAPRFVPPSEYIGIVMGSNDSFANEREATKVMDLMFRHFNMIVEQLQRTRRTDDIYVPALIVDEQGVPAGNEWAAGFMCGVSLSEEGWPELMQTTELAEMIAPMTALATELDPDPARRSPAIAPEDREDLLESMFVGLADIYAHFEPRRQPPSAQNPSPQTVKRTEPKLGRNDPCPCGSGKKFKQCCGTAPTSLH
jgi:uncharacterized protein